MRWKEKAMTTVVTLLLVNWSFGQSKSPATTTQPQTQQASVQPQTPTTSNLQTLPQVRLKDIATLHWGAEVPLVGYGLVVGLDGTGDSRQVAFTVQSIANMLRRFGINVDPTRLQLRNVAAVMVTATLPPFAKLSDRLDVLVSAIGDARSIHGGVLLQTPLQAADGEVYAIAQGPISIGGFNVQAGGTAVQKNHPTTGRIVNGASVVRPLSNLDNVFTGDLEVRLIAPDATNAAKIAQAVNERFGKTLAEAISPGAIRVKVPEEFAGKVLEFVAQLEQVSLQPDMRAKVIINERTGTVVMGGNVRILPVVVAHGALRVEIKPEVTVVQPPPFSQGATVVVPTTQIKAEEQRAQVAILQSGATVQDLVQALQALRVTPRDLIAILQALKQSGALLADVEVQ
ncbi:MAG: flagellar basal body P-ring protein FlgI [Candidatus Fervidibacter sp.]|uniref:flagellar basal body P-ring protein FlgI n=1 Tax=Candidatus Fervidibacter sp. TaxID=3100871 RepID=UPI00404B10C8